MLNIPYTGSDPLTLAICLDKARTKEILSYHKIPTAKFFVVENLDEFDGNIDLEFPLIVKPLHEGSSKGIFNSSVVENNRELLSEIERVLRTYNEPALVEEFLPGREFTVAILGNGKEAKVLPIIEIKFDSLPTEAKPIYSFEAKWIRIHLKDIQIPIFINSHIYSRIIPAPSYPVAGQGNFFNLLFKLRLKRSRTYRYRLHVIFCIWNPLCFK